MNKKVSLLIAFFSLSLLLVYFFPLWSIQLEAPQYPEGLGMEIWINKLGGDIRTINGLNHYIGMHNIDEQAIPELKLMPFSLGGIILLGLLAAAWRKKWFFLVWVSLFAVLGGVAGYDFYSWEYDYGHNLNPHAAIIVPGMSYQPPLIGSKQLLNFTAHSYPDIGGWTIMTVGVLSVLLCVYVLFSDRKNQRGMPLSGWVLVFGLFGLISCKSGSEPIKYGFDACQRCSMKIVESRFGAEIVTKKGKVYTFDSIECLMHYLLSKPENKQTAGTVLVTDATRPGEFIDATKAYYLKSEKYPSPMGENLSADQDSLICDKQDSEFGGVRMSWKELLVLYSK